MQPLSVSSPGPTSGRPSGALTFRAEPRSHRGKVRTRNEDALLMHPGSRVWAVADGMGGHERGDLASATLSEVLATALDKMKQDKVNDDRPSAAVGVIERAVGRTHDLLARRRENMGTTLAAVLVSGALAVALWVGDSRVYHQRGNRFTLLTRDHVVSGGALSRCVGLGDDCRLDVAAAHIVPRDRLLICTDGLTRELSDAAMSGILSSGGGLIHCADLLLDAALRGEARDNVSFVLVEAL